MYTSSISKLFIFVQNPHCIFDNMLSIRICSWWLVWIVFSFLSLRLPNMSRLSIQRAKGTVDTLYPWGKIAEWPEKSAILPEVWIRFPIDLIDMYRNRICCWIHSWVLECDKNGSVRWNRGELECFFRFLSRALVLFVRHILRWRKKERPGVVKRGSVKS